MRKTLYQFLLLLSLLSCPISSVFAEFEFQHCNCDSYSTGFWTSETIFKWQKASDFLIAVAYFSIPLELLYSVSRLPQPFPFKWLLFQFGSFIVLCGLTHLLTTFTYGPHTFILSLSLTIAKFLTSLVSFLTAITLLTLIPQLLRIKVRENLLWLKTNQLRREVRLMKRQEETRLHVRMLTHEIRKYLDRHTILYTTLVELSKALDLQNCAVWMPEKESKTMILTHELQASSSVSNGHKLSVPMDDPDVMEIVKTVGVKLIRDDSLIGSASSGEMGQPGPVAAVRMQMLKVSDFKGGTPELIQASYAILVLVLPNNGCKKWGPHDLEIVEVVADQVAVALSHAAVLEESQLMRERLAEQNRVLLKAKRDAIMANEARNVFQKAMSQGMKRPIYSILGLVSMMKGERLNPEQRLAIKGIARTGAVVLALVDDVMEISNKNRERFGFEMRACSLKSLIKESACVAKSLCEVRGLNFHVKIESLVPDCVLGDERRVFHLILHMVGSLLDSCNGGVVNFRVYCGEKEEEELRAQMCVPWWRPNYSNGFICVKFEFGLKRFQSFDDSNSNQSHRIDKDLSFSMCKKLVQLMQGNIYASVDTQGHLETMTLLLGFQLQPPISS